MFVKGLARPEVRGPVAARVICMTLSLLGKVIRTWTTPGDNPLLVAASDGKLWMTGNAAVWSVDPNCR